MSPSTLLLLQLVVPEVEVLLPSALRCLLVQILHDGVGDLLHLLLLVFQILEVRVGGLVEPIQRLVDGGLELLCMKKRRRRVLVRDSYVGHHRRVNFFQELTTLRWSNAVEWTEGGSTERTLRGRLIFINP